MTLFLEGEKISILCFHSHAIIIIHAHSGYKLSIYKKSRSGSELQEVEVTSQQVEVSDIH
jgi:hypothetical protein